MFPKLSQKAWDEIRRITPKYDFPVDYFDSILLTDIPDVINAYTSLFDLEKYPITWEQLVEFADANGIHTYDKCIIIRLNDSDDDYYFSESQDGTSATIEYVSKFLDKDKIIVIGEMHGWWEKGEAE